MVRHHQRLANARIAEALRERGVVEQDALQHAMQRDASGETSFAESLIESNHIGDWELSQIVCEVYGLPFVPVDVAEPDKELLSLVDIEFLQQTGLVPLAKYGQVLTVCMPGIVPAEILGTLEAQTELCVLPVVGTVRTNRNWLNEHVGARPDPALPSAAGEWSNIFDQGDAAVLLDLDDESLT